MATKQCSKCKEVKSINEFHKNKRSATGLESQCKECRNAHCRKYSQSPQRKEKCKRYQASPEGRYRARLAYKEKYDKHKYKFAARRKVILAIKKGILVRLACQVCGDDKSVGHHEDYDRPLDVMWLCRKHHAEVHRNGVA